MHNTATVSFVPYTSENHARYEKQLVRCYQEVFLGAPWNEVWSPEEVLAVIATSNVPRVSRWIAVCEDQVVGFTWGYPMKSKDVEEKLQCVLPFAAECEVAYQAELGVLPAYRNQGIARTLLRLRNECLHRLGIETGVVRVKKAPEPSVTYLWYVHRLEYVEIASYPADDGRVILAAPLKNSF